MKKICVVTGTRAEFGLLYWLMKRLEAAPEFELQVIVTGMHLSPEFGLTFMEVEKEFKVNKKVEMLLSSDSSVGISKSMGLAQISMAEAYNELQPDLVVLLGDRFEIFSAASAAMIARIPIAHLHGGEATEGLIDESIRHSITKMSHLHFTATESYRRRVIQLGEHPDRVFCVGGLGIENIKRLNLLHKNDFEESIGFKLGDKNALVTFHPVTLEESTAKQHFKNLLNALEIESDIKLIFTKSNSDTDGRIINQLIDQYVTEHPDTAVCFASLGQLRYLSALQFVDFVIGNSSSGLAEVPSFKIPTINIGDRQKGRAKAESVIDCPPTTDAIIDAIELAYSKGFQKVISTVNNPYGSGNASEKIINHLRQVNLENLLKKSFFDVEVKF